MAKKKITTRNVFEYQQNLLDDILRFEFLFGVLEGHLILMEL